MNRLFLRSLVYTIGALVLVICHIETRPAGQVDITLQDDSGRIMTYSFPAVVRGSYFQEITAIRNGQICHFELSNKVVFGCDGGIGIRMDYHGTRDGHATVSNQTLPVLSARSQSTGWIHLDDHLLASATLR